ncbi:MAG TPA: hypothetical protein VMX54_01945 [Vicinamibacteria bacterium]|nr:hypothetical protein [Vicinamibacteria bacterium]
MVSPRAERFWEKAAAPVRIIGAILLGAGSIHLYASRLVFDAPTFAARAASSLGDPRVAGFAAEKIADQVIAQKRDLMAFRPLLIGTARAILASEGFRAAFRRAAERAHQAVFSEEMQRVALSLPDVGVFVRAAVAHDPALAAKIPASLHIGGGVPPGDRLAKGVLLVARLGHRWRRNAVLELGFGSLLLALSIALQRDRRQALLRGGAALATVAVVVLFLPPIARTAITAVIPRADLRPVVAGVFDAFTGGLRWWALALGGMGVVLAAAASSLASQMEIEEFGRRTWARLRQPAPQWQGEIVRAAVLTVVGLLAALQPVATMQGLTVVVGALLGFEGLRRLFMLVPPRIEEAARQASAALAEARERAGGPSAVRVAVHHSLVALLVIALIGGAVFLVKNPDALPKAPALTDACNGDPSLCDRRLDQVVFAGAHNSMAAAEFPRWMFPNQELGSVSLLGHGIRALLFDVHYGTPVGGEVKTDLEAEKASRAKMEKAVGPEALAAAMRVRDRLTGAPTGPRAPYLCHGFCELGAVPLQGMLEGVRDFLVQNPGEVLVFVIEDYVAPEEIMAAFRASGLERFVYRGPVTPPFPTLRRMIDSDQRVVVFGENLVKNVDWYHPAFATFQETPYRFRTPDEFSCQANRGGTSGPLFQINHWIETVPAPKPSNAVVVNGHDFLLARARQCQKQRGKLPNILAVDFAMTGDVLAVAAELNGVGGAAPGP